MKIDNAILCGNCDLLIFEAVTVCPICDEGDELSPFTGTIELSPMGIIHADTFTGYEFSTTLDIYIKDSDSIADTFRIEDFRLVNFEPNVSIHTTMSEDYHVYDDITFMFS